MLERLNFMNINIIKRFKPIYIFLFLLITGFLFRIYNINFDDLWIDEISTFWISNPDFSFKESYLNHKSLEQTPFLFNFIIKIFYGIFGYKIEISRHLPLFFSFLSILSVSYISRLISNNNGFIFTSFLIAYNIFLIGYSQELRVYSTLFFFVSLSIIFFIKCIQQYKFNNLLFFNTFTIISILLHPFAIIILMSCLSVVIIFKKISYKNLNISLIAITIFSLVFYYHFVKSSIATPSWILQPDLKFFTNFYFSKFFGSRLIGLIHLLIFIFLILKFYKKILNNEKIFLLFSILIYSYFFPLIYGFFFKPILVPRYIIFVLIPITTLITYFIFELSNKKRFILIFLILFITLGNLFTEQTLKQFYNKRVVYKPEFNKALNIIKDSNKKNFSIKLDTVTKEISKNTWNKAVKHYLLFLISKNDLDIVYKKMDKIKNESTWVFCIHDLNHNNCDLSENFKIYKIINLNRLDLILTSVK
jgi:hypothetical protein